MSTTLPWHPFLSPSKPYNNRPLNHSYNRPQTLTITNRPIQAFQRSDFDGFAKRVASGQVWKEAWRNANDGFEQLVFDAKKAAERFDRRYSVSNRVTSLAESAAYQARLIDREYEIGRRWRSFTLDFSRNLPMYRKQLNGFLNTPLGRSFSTIFFLWFALSGWLFRILIFATWVLPFAAPLLIGTVAKNFVIEGACPACKKRFMGYKNQVVRCTSCGNIVWQPKGDFFSRGGGGRGGGPESDIIDVEFEEK